MTSDPSSTTRNPVYDDSVPASGGSQQLLNEQSEDEDGVEDLLRDESVDKTSAEFRRCLRKKYRALRKEIEERKQDMVTADTGSLVNMIKRVDKLQTLVKQTREQAVDTDILRSLTELGVELVKKLNEGIRLCTPMELLNKLLEKYMSPMSVKSTESKLQWKEIGSEASRYLGHVATSTTMLGPLGDPSSSQAIRQVRQRAKKRKLGEVVHAEEIENPKDEAGSHKETDRKANAMMKEIKRLYKERNHPVPMPAVVLDVQSFSRTVESIFTLSFLAGRGIVSLRMKDKEMEASCENILIEPCKPPGSDQAVKSTQHVTNFDMQQWKDLVTKCQ